MINLAKNTQIIKINWVLNLTLIAENTSIQMHGLDYILAVATGLASGFACLKLKHYLQILH